MNKKGLNQSHFMIVVFQHFPCHQLPGPHLPCTEKQKQHRRKENFNQLKTECKASLVFQKLRQKV
jgi:hypothetical protein